MSIRKRIKRALKRLRSVEATKQKWLQSAVGALNYEEAALLQFQIKQIRVVVDFLERLLLEEPQ